MKNTCKYLEKSIPERITRNAKILRGNVILYKLQGGQYGWSTVSKGNSGDSKCNHRSSVRESSPALWMVGKTLDFTQEVNPSLDRKPLKAINEWKKIKYSPNINLKAKFWILFP